MLDTIFKRRDDVKHQIIFGIIFVFAVCALLASFQLSIDKLRLLENPNEQLSCSVNAVINCASIMKTPQASLLGFPNSFIGLIGYGAVVFFALAGLLGVRYTKTVLRIVYLGTLAALAFALWLFFDGLYVIQILCPWCLLMSFSTVVICAAMTRIAFQENIFSLKKELYKQPKKFFQKQYDVFFFACAILILLALIILKFGDSLLG